MFQLYSSFSFANDTFNVPAVVSVVVLLWLNGSMFVLMTWAVQSARYAVGRHGSDVDFDTKTQFVTLARYGGLIDANKVGIVRDAARHKPIIASSMTAPWNVVLYACAFTAPLAAAQLTSAPSEFIPSLVAHRWPCCGGGPSGV